VLGAGPPRRTVPAAAVDSERPEPRRNRAGVLLAALATVALLAVIAVLLLSGGDGGDPGNQTQAESTPQRTETPTPTNTPEDTATPEPTPTTTATETPTPEPTEAPSGRVDLDKARQLQLDGFNARQSGDYARALTLSQQALDACGNSDELDPCGYALFEKGLALNRSGRPDEAIPVLEERLDRFGDNDKGEVAKELKAAKKAAKD
jgi:tetratricopeptide (TPR) repeat protein